MESKINLQLFAEGESTGNEAPSQPGEAENASEESKEQNNEDAAIPGEEPGADTKKAEGPSVEGGENEGEEESLPEQNGELLLQSVETALNEKLKNDGVKKIIDDWVKSGEELKEVYPGFDLKNELKNNGDFCELLKAGVSVRRAYEAANLEKILGSALRYAALTAGKKTAQSVLSQTGRVQENSVLDRASSLSRKDVNSLTKNDILKILDEVSRGATIKF
ncbi:MAG: hypothetical protein IJS90_02375 [Clostridia bacterium]|nr:hypothetical protein [Clostridia bacterium]